MARITNLDDIVPDDEIIQYRGIEYRIPGDPPTEYILSLWGASQKIQEGLSLEDQVETMQKVHDQLLRVFQIADPNITSLPFGVRGLVAVTQILFGLYGVIDPDASEESEEDFSKAPAAGRKSRRSSGSRS